MADRKVLTAYEWKENPMDLLQHRWALLSAGNEEIANTMTVSWGGVGILWNKPVCFAFVRPQRHTKQFMDRFDKFSLSFFEENEKNKRALAFCGKASGRDTDKFSVCGFEKEMVEDCLTIAQAKTTLVCKKLFVQRMTEDSFLAEEIKNKNYPYGDYHYVYIGEIEQVITEEDGE